MQYTHVQVSQTVMEQSVTEQWPKWTKFIQNPTVVLKGFE